MAKFDLWYKKILSNDKYTLSPLALYTTKNGNIISDGCFDESLTKSGHSFCSLNFKIAKYSFSTGFKKINSLVEKINQGTQIRLRENSGNIIDFIVTKISYEIHSSNIVLQVSCQDLFSYSMTKRNSGYKLDALDDYDFIGSLTFDEWVKRICDDCKITGDKWTYKELSVTGEKINEIMNEISEWKEKIDYSSFDALKSFSVSDSNGYNALTSLGDLYGLNLIAVYDDTDPFFFYVPNKNPKWSGFSYHPQLDLRELSISSNYENFATILNVTSQTDKDGNEISIIPVIPSRILSYFNTEEWNNSHYYPGYYDFLIGTLAGLKWDDGKWETSFSETESLFKKFADVVPYLENKLIDYNYFLNINFLSQNDADYIQNTIYDKLRISNGKKMYYNNAFFTALSRRNSFYSNLQSLTQKFHAALDSYIAENGKVSTITKDSFVKSTLEELKIFINKNSLWNNQSETGKEAFINIDELLTSLMNDFIKYEQKFLQSLYELQLYIIDNNISDFSNSDADLLANMQNFWNQLQYYGEYTDYYVPDFDTSTAKNLLESLRNKNRQYVNKTEDQIKKVLWTADLNNVGVFVDGEQKNDIYWFTESLAPFRSCGWKGVTVPEEVIFYSWSNDTLRQDWSYVSLSDFGSQVPMAGLYKTYMVVLDWCVNETTIAKNLRIYSEESKNIWKDLYSKYPSIFLEADFKDETATSSEQLLKSAQNYFEELKSPVVEYDISTIDIRSVYRERKEDNEGNTSFIESTSILNPKITDQIRISAASIEDRPGELYQILNKALFVNEIEQELRSDIVKLKVNPLTYTDILLKNLAKLVM